MVVILAPLGFEKGAEMVQSYAAEFAILWRRERSCREWAALGNANRCELWHLAQGNGREDKGVFGIDGGLTASGCGVLIA
jgi:hypothetical protein